MKALHLLPAVLATGATVFSVAAGQEDTAPLNQTCTVGSFLFNNSTLGLYCNNDDWAHWAYDWTMIDLNLCVGNNLGTLVAYPNGNYTSSCSGCNVTWSHVYESSFTTIYATTPDPAFPTTITAQYTPRWDDLYLGCTACEALDGSATAPSELDLNQFMINNNGTVGCFSYLGSTQVAKPAAIKTPAPTLT